MSEDRKVSKINHSKDGISALVNYMAAYMQKEFYMGTLTEPSTPRITQQATKH